jgi:tRNA (guanine10-N2)-dimethyltransferase
VNLTGLCAGDTVLDPFCGTGGLLLEAGLMGMNVIGSDIDPRMVEGTHSNLKHFGVSNYKLFQTDIIELTNNLDKNLPVDAIVTEPPYGRASPTQGKTIEELTEQAFVVFSQILNSNAPMIISLPNSELPESVQENFILMNKFNIRIHRSLTKTIFQLQKK